MKNPSSDAAILILAAGRSSRMRGVDKLLERVDGQMLIRRQVQVALATGLPVWVTLPPDQPLRADALHGLNCMLVEVSDAGHGISHSIRAGNAAVHPSCWLILLLADLPEITTTDLEMLITAAQDAPNAIVRATSDAGKPGHPILFPPHLRGELTALCGDEGARDILKLHADETIFVPLHGNRALTDLDTPEDWARWRLQHRPKC